jgi:hypothetical protein
MRNTLGTAGGSEVDQVLSVFEPLLGMPCWGLSWDCNTGLHLDFGRPQLLIGEAQPIAGPTLGATGQPRQRHVEVEGQWRLWINGHWKLSLSSEEAPVRSSSSWSAIQPAIARLEGQELRSLTIRADTGATRFEFDLGGILEARRQDRGDDFAIWDLVTPDGRMLQVRGDGCWALAGLDVSDPAWFALAARA